MACSILSGAAASEPSIWRSVCKRPSPGERLRSRCAGEAACCRAADAPRAMQVWPAHPAEDLQLLQQGPWLWLRGLLRGQALSSPCGAWGKVQLQRCAGHPGLAQVPAHQMAPLPSALCALSPSSKRDTPKQVQSLTTISWAVVSLGYTGYTRKSHRAEASPASEGLPA